MEELIAKHEHLFEMSLLDSDLSTFPYGVFCVVRLTMSVPRSMQRMVTVPSGRGISQRINAKKGEISGMFEVKV